MMTSFRSMYLGSDSEMAIKENGFVMASSDQMPKVEFGKDKLLTPSTQEWMKIIEAQNRNRVLKLKKLRKKNLFTGLLLGAAVVGIYSYTILTVKQETFLDDFEEPKFKEVQ